MSSRRRKKKNLKVIAALFALSFAIAISVASYGYFLNNAIIRAAERENFIRLAEESSKNVRALEAQYISVARNINMEKTAEFGLVVSKTETFVSASAEKNLTLNQQEGGI